MLSSDLCLSAIAAAAALLGAGAAVEENTIQPIKLVSESTDSGISLQVVGTSPTIYSADYTLEVTSGDAGGNRNSQSGSVTLRPNEQVVLLTTRLGGAAGRRWRALLTVTPHGASSYQIERVGG